MYKIFAIALICFIGCQTTDSTNPRPQPVGTCGCGTGVPSVETYLLGGATPDTVLFRNKVMIPTDDDQALAETVRTGFRTISDRTRHIQNFASKYRPFVEAVSLNGTDISINRAYPVMVYDPTTDPNSPAWLQFDLHSPTTYTPPGIVANTHYYVYGVNNAGNLDFVTSTTPPDVQLIGKGGDVAFRYLFHFRTSPAGAITQFYNVGGRVHFRDATVTDASPGVGASGTAGLGTWIPAHSKRAIVRTRIVNTTGAPLLTKYFQSVVPVAEHEIQTESGGSASDLFEISAPAQNVDISVSGGSLNQIQLFAAGYIDQ